MTIGMILVMSLSYRSKLLEKIHAIGWLGLLVALIFAINTTFFQLSVQTTNVTDTLVIIATAPLFAAILSVIFQRAYSVRTWVTILICFLAVGLVFAGRLDGGHLFGNFAALISAIGLGTHFVLVRLKREVDMTPAIGLASLLTCFIGFNMSSIYILSRSN